MSQDDLKPLRHWREIAKEASEGHDPNKALELAEELIRALDKESRRHMDDLSPTGKAKERGAV